MNKMTNYLKEHTFSILMLLVMLTFYLFFAIYDGVVICVDSPSYLNMSFSREPFYPLFLAFFRILSSENALLYAVIVQSILMAFCGWKLADYLRVKLKIHKIYSILLYFIPIASSLLCRFAAKRSSMYTNSILSEGICTSLYLLFIYCLLNYIWDESVPHIILGWFLSFLMISTRKQMLMVLPLLFLSMIYAGHCHKKLWKSIVISSICCLLIFPCFQLFDCTYNYFVRGTFQGHSSSNRFVTTMVFYNAERNDADYIADSEAKQLFLNIYDVCSEKGYLGSNAGDGWFEKVTHFGDHYDHIQIDTMWPMILQHAKETIASEFQNTGISEEEFNTLYNKESDRLNSIIIHSLLPHQLPDFIQILFYNFLSGLIITIAQLRPIFIPYTIVMFLAYGLLTLRLFLFWRKNLKASATPCRLFPENVQHAQRCVEFSVLTLLGILCNVLLVSAVIFCQTRYTIYNMPLFYIAGAILLYQNIMISLENR